MYNYPLNQSCILILAIEHLQKLKKFQPRLPEVEVVVEKPIATKSYLLILYFRIFRFFVEKHTFSAKSNAALALSNPVSFQSISPVINVSSQATAFEFAEEIERKKSLKIAPNNDAEIERTKIAYEKINRQKVCAKIYDSLEAELKESKSAILSQPVVSRPVPLSATGALKDKLYFDKQKHLEEGTFI